MKSTHDKKVLVVGCSMTSGDGLDLGVNDPDLWVNRAFGHLGHIHNIAKSGMNNQWIFHEALGAMLQKDHDYDVVVIGWSAIPRFYFNVGLELYSTHTKFDNLDVNVKSGRTFSGAWLKDIGDRLIRMHNDHWDILDLVKYVNALIMVHETSPEKKIFFVNTLSPWCSGYFDVIDFSLPSQLDPYEQDLLQVETRDDTEVLSLYSMIHKQYADHGGIRASHWLNLYESLRSMQVDNISHLNRHPGYLSQKRYSEYFCDILRTRLDQM